MGCQRDVARKVTDKKADYVVALEGSQGSLREDVETFVAERLLHPIPPSVDAPPIRLCRIFAA